LQLCTQISSQQVTGLIYMKFQTTFLAVELFHCVTRTVSVDEQYSHYSTSIQFRRAGQQGPTRTLTAALKRVIKQLLCTYSITQVKYYKKTRKINLFNAIPKNI